MKSKFFDLQLYYIVLISIILYSCHNAKAPNEKITTTPIVQGSSVVFIPISISNAGLSQLIKSKIPSPIKETTQVIKIPVINPLTEPTITLVKVPFDYACDVTEHVHLSGWKCAACPSCCIFDRIVHTTCQGFKDVEKVIDKNIIKKITMDVPLYYKILAKDIRLDGNKNQLGIHLVLDFALRADIDTKIIKTLVASCGIGEPMAEIELTLLTKINMLDDGKLSLSDKIWEVKWNKPCNLTALDIDVESLLNLPVIKNIIENKIDDVVQNKIPNSLEYKSQLEKIWPTVSQPVTINELGNLDMNIKELLTEDLSITSNEIWTNIGAICIPVLDLTNDNGSTKQKSFPKLSVKSGNDSFNINILGSATFKSLNKYANQALKNYKEKIENNYLEFNDLNLYQHADSIVVEASLNKPFNGKIYLWGVPKFDLSKNTISLQNLQYTTESKNLLIKMSNWLIQAPILQNAISDKFQYNFEKSIGNAISKIKNLDYSLASNVNLKVSCNEIKPVNIIVSDNKLNVVVNLRGQALLTIK